MKRKKVVLIFNRRNGDLWVDVENYHIACMWNVTEVKKREESDNGGVLIFSKGEQIGNVWGVADIKERWW